jgi:fatty-acid desaturase
MLIIIIFALVLFLIDPMLLLCYSIGTAGALVAMGFINTICHTRNITTYCNYDTRDDSSNSYLAVLIGEWHNNHHARPRDWNQWNRWWEIDYAAQFIRVIKI